MDLSTSGPGAMSAIAAAVTPVVMISANAILIGAVSAKHQAMADRVRALSAEWRQSAVTPERRETIRAQVALFEDRFNWITRAHILLYVATCCFIAMVIAIAVTSLLRSWERASFPLLICGVSLTFTAILLELIDLSKARKTILLESADLIGYNRRS